MPTDDESQTQPDTQPATEPDASELVVLIGPDGQHVDPAQEPAGEHGHEGGAGQLTDLVEEPAKVMRIGRMVQHILEEVRSTRLDEPGRKRLADVLHSSINELKDGVAPALDEELDRLIKPFDQDTPSDSELRIAQAQLVGWLEGLFHGIQTAIYAQQMAARAQLEQMSRALPPGQGGPGAPQGFPGMGQPGQPGQDPQSGGQGGGMYL